MIEVKKKFFIREKNESFYPGEVVDLDADQEQRALDAGVAEKSKAKSEKRIKPIEGQKAENERLKQEKLAKRKGESQKEGKSIRVTAGKDKE